MSIKTPPKAGQAFTLVEVLVATGVAGIVVVVIATLAIFTSRSFVAATNYSDMALASRMALDNVSRTIRQARQVTACTTNSLTFIDSTGNNVQYSFDPSRHNLLCVAGGVTNTYLTGCDSLQFWIYQRTPISNQFACYNPASVTNAKLVQVTWSCSRQIFGAKVNSEVVESASICLRNH
jgi:type II secretory pathway pseudopilin PulG